MPLLWQEKSHLLGRLLRRVSVHARLLREALYALWQQDVSRMCAAIAYFGAFSLAPILVIMISLASLVFGRQASEGLVVDRLAETLGENTARFIQSMLAGIYESSGLTVATVLAVLLLAWAATRIVGAVRGALNDIWGVEGHGGFGFRGYMVGKLIDVGMVILFGFMFLASMVASTGISALTHYFSDVLPLPGLLLEVLGFVFSLVVTTSFLTIIFRLLPNIRVRLRYIVTGASVTAVLFALGNFVIGRYLGRLTPASAFGAAGSLAVILIWMYYSAHIILFGAQVTKVYVERARPGSGGGFRPRGEEVQPQDAGEIAAPLAESESSKAVSVVADSFETELNRAVASESNGRSEAGTPDERPQLAYLILVHKNPEQAARLVSRLNVPGVRFFVHVDKGTPSAVYHRFCELLAPFPNVHLVKRHRSRWGEFGIVRATLETMQAALASRPPVDYLVLLTGQDYPIKSAAEIETFFARADGRSYLDYHPVPSPSWPQAERRLQSWYARILGEQVLLPRRQPLRAVWRRPRRWPVWLISLVLPSQRRLPKGCVPYTGSAYWALSRAAGEYVLEFVRKNRRFVRYFRRVFCPDEIFFQTVLVASPLQENIVSRSLHYIDWSKGGAHPAVLTAEDLPALGRSEALFARKFDPEVDPRILDLIDKTFLGWEASGSPESQGLPWQLGASTT